MNTEEIIQAALAYRDVPDEQRRTVAQVRR